MSFLSSFRQGRLKFDLFANFAGLGWSAVIQALCIPFYIKFLGIEAYGLTAFYLVLAAMLQVLDLGLTPTINREMARYSVQPDQAAEARDLVRTLEAGYWMIGLMIGTALLVMSPLIATHWIKAGSFPIRSIRQAVMIMGILAFFQWPISFYQGALLGLRQQGLFNLIKISLVTVTHGGALLILWRASRTVQAFFLWMAAMSAVQVAALAYSVWKSLPRTDRPSRFDPGLLRKIWRFTAGVSGIAASGLILTQMDKVVLSKLVNLRTFGYYTLAGIFGTGLMMIVTAVMNTVFPRFSAMAAAHDEPALTRLYHGATQLMVVLIVPIAAVLALFPRDVLFLWTRNAEVARHAAPIAAALVTGTALNALTTVPYSLQLAHGWTSFMLSINACFIVTLVPAVFYMALHYGPLGAACVWVALNATSMAVGVPVTHRRLLRHELTRWFAEDVAPASAAALVVSFVGRALLTSPMRPAQTMVSLACLYLAALTAGILAAPRIRSRLLGEIELVASTMGRNFRRELG